VRRARLGLSLLNATYAWRWILQCTQFSSPSAEARARNPYPAVLIPGGNASRRVIELEALPFVNQVYARIAFGVLRFNEEDTHSISAAVIPNMARVLPVSGVRVSSVN
jgi:hypothetical protein